MTEVAEVERKVADFVCRSARLDAIARDEPIFESGLVTSMFALQIVMFVEKEFGLTLDDDDLNIRNFASVEAIATFVAAKADAAEAL